MTSRATGAISAILVDDEQLASEELSYLLKEFPEVEILATGKNGLEAGADPGSGYGCGVDGAAHRIFGGNPGDAGGVPIERIEAELIGNKKPNEDTTGEADGQAEDIDEGKCFFPEKVSEREFKVICDHI